MTTWNIKALALNQHLEEDTQVSKHEVTFVSTEVRLRRVGVGESIFESPWGSGETEGVLKEGVSLLSVYRAWQLLDALGEEIFKECGLCHCGPFLRRQRQG